MPPWLSHISSYQNKESKIHSSRFIQLATIGLDTFPRVRTVVFRGWSDSYELKILSDNRSPKFEEIKNNNKVEICWLFQKSKCQFRLRGKASIDYGQDRYNHWEMLDNNNKKMWGWPNPGSSFDIEKKQIMADKASNNYDNFILLKININYVDQLKLIKPTHYRRRWIREDEWIEERVNP